MWTRRQILAASGATGGSSLIAAATSADVVLAAKKKRRRPPKPQPQGWVNTGKFGSYGSKAHQFIELRDFAISPNGLLVAALDYNSYKKEGCVELSVWQRSAIGSAKWEHIDRFKVPGRNTGPLTFDATGQKLFIGYNTLHDEVVQVWGANGDQTRWTFLTTFHDPNHRTAQLGQLQGFSSTNTICYRWGRDSDWRLLELQEWTRSLASEHQWEFNKVSFTPTIGSGLSQFSGITGGTVSADGKTACFGDSANFRSRVMFWRRDSTQDSWRFSATIGSHGSLPSQFVSPAPLQISEDGTKAFIQNYGEWGYNSPPMYTSLSIWTRETTETSLWQPFEVIRPTDSITGAAVPTVDWSVAYNCKSVIGRPYMDFWTISVWDEL